MRRPLILALLLTAAPAAAESDFTRTARIFDGLRTQPARLLPILRDMPKGGDLHTHLWGAVYAEDLLDEAGKAGFCVTAAGTAITPPPCHTGPDVAMADRTVPATGLSARDPVLYSRLIDALSMRGHVPVPGTDALAGHDRFFATFERFGAIASHAPGRLLAEARIIAAGDHVSYLELQSNPPAIDVAATLALHRHVPVDDPAAALAALAPDLPRLIAAARRETDRMEQDADRRLGCAPARPACTVLVRYQAVAIRALPPEMVFGQLALAFALADADPRYVGVNIVAPEDGPVALADYDRHMAMLRFLSRRYPNVPMSLHAGELVAGLVPPKALGDHIAKAVTVAGARRIGHGVAIGQEADAAATLARMARDGIAVEIALGSNAMILGVRGADHPLALYRAAGVPVVIASDDQGVARSDMTREYLRAVTEQGLGYADLKAIARASLRYAFLRGKGLGEGGLPATSDKARAQSRLESEFTAFEQSIARGTHSTGR